MRQALDLSIDREAINQVVFNGEFKPGNQWVNPDHPYYQKAFRCRQRDVAKAKALLKEAGVTPPVSVDFMVPKGAETEAVAQVIQSMAAGDRLRHEDQGHRVRDLAETGRGRRIPGLSCWPGADGSIPTAIPTSSCKTDAPQNYSAWSNAGGRQGARRRAASSPTRRSARRSTKS